MFGPPHVFLSTKFQPPLPRVEMLPRPRLVDALNDHLDRRLQIVVAPAGFGKTTLLAAFIREVALPVCWVTLDHGDRDLVDFVELLVAALRHRFPSFGAATADLLHRSVDSERDITALARSLAIEIETSVDTPTLLVLDDFQDVNESPPVTRFLDALLRALPARLRVIVAGRTMPNLSLSRLVMDDDMFGLGEADLRFTPNELVSLLRAEGAEEIDPEQAAALARQAEGWIAGFLLSVPHLRQGIVGNLLAGRDQGELVYEYLAAEAFDRQPADAQRFLVATSIPETPDPALCVVLLGRGDWAAMRDRVEAAGLFVTRLRGGRGAFRYHSLFRRFLQARLARTQPLEYARLHTLAGSHEAEQGAWQKALAHFQEGGAEPEALALLARIVPELERAGRWRSAASALEGFDPERLAQRPDLALIGAWASQMAGDFARADALAHAARVRGAVASDPRLEARALARLGIIRRMQGQTAEAVTLLHDARRLAAADAEIVATVRLYLGQCLGAQGEMGAAAGEFEAALAYFAANGPPQKAADAESALATALDLAGRPADALARHESARAKWSGLGDTGLEALSLASIGSLSTRLGEYERARVALDSAVAKAREGNNERAERVAVHALGHLLLATGDVEGAHGAFRQGLALAAQARDYPTAAHMHEGIALALALTNDLARAEEHASEAAVRSQTAPGRQQAARAALTLAAIRSRAGRRDAVPILQAAATTLEETGSRWDLTRAHLWLATAHAAAGTEAAARHHVRTALRLAEDLGSDAIIDLHARWNPAFFTAAAAEGIESERLDAVLARTGYPRHREEPALPAGTAGTTPVVVRAFGAATAYAADGSAIAWGRDKARELFFLLLHRGPQRQEQLTAILWPDGSTKARQNFYSAVYMLRHAIHPDVIVRKSGLYRVNDALVGSYDGREFERLLDAADSDQTAETALRERAIDLYAGRFLADLDAEWCDEERERLEHRYLAALERLADGYAEAGRLRESIAIAERLVRRDPLREDAHARIIRAYLRIGDRAAAQRQFEACAAALRDELGISPSAELQALARHVRS